MSVKIIVNGVFYFFLTAFFVYIFIKEKSIAKKIEVYCNKFSEKLASLFKIKNEAVIYKIKKTVHFIETIITALILVLVLQRFYIGNFKIPTGSMIPTIEVGDRVFANMVVYKFFQPSREDIVVFKEPIQNKVLYTKRLMALPGEKIRISNGELYINDISQNIRKYSDLGIQDKEWRVPKKGDKLSIIPAGNYEQAFKEYNIDIGKVQEEISKNSIAINSFLPNLKFLVNGEETGLILDFIHDKEVLKELIEGKEVEVVLDKDYYFVLGDNTNHSFDSRFWGFVSENRIRGKCLVRFWPLNRIGLLK